MDLSAFRILLSPPGQQVLKEAAALQPREVDFLGHFTALSRLYPADLARAALEIAILRTEASAKLPFAGRLYLTRPALEQASSYPVACYRAERLRGFDRLLDLGCSVGGDTFALAHQAHTLGVDLDPLRLAMARANLEALGLGDRAALLQADLTDALPFSTEKSDSLALFFDPGRRAGERRLRSVHAYRPPLGVIESWLPRFPALAVKISPGVDLDELRDFEAEIEFISLNGELKEAVLWFGPLKSARRRATVLPGPHSFVDPTGAGVRQAQPLPLDEPRAYLYEPDPSILRAGLVQPLGWQLGAAQLDPDIAYLTSERLVDTPFARAWQVETWLPFSLKRLRAALRQRGVNRVVVKKRGSPLQPEELIRELRLKTDKGAAPVERVVFLTHLRGAPIAALCYPQAPEGQWRGET
ncbi:MAG: methyltransferase domain-containing protein [Anaerolineales bacterium]|nr:methyltransferase domain-containing protein [Anaerolineales bacterium]